MKICPRSSRSTRKRSRTSGSPPPRPRRITVRPDLTGDCWLFFGKETAGLPEAFRLAHADRCVRLPMRAEARSLNLSQLRRHPHL